MGTWAAWAGAYAFVLHAILTSVLLAGISPASAAAGFEICASGVEHALPDDSGKTSKTGIVHCSLCASHHAGGALPPLASASVVRIATVLERGRAFEQRMFGRPQASRPQPRAPPARA